MNIIDLIPEGRKNIIDRYTLTHQCIAYGLIKGNVKDPNREMEKLIKQARRDAVIIAGDVINCNPGYYRPTPEEYQDAESWISKEEQRIVSTVANLTHARKWVADAKAGRLSLGKE